MIDPPKRGLVDHLISWLAAGLTGSYGVITFAALLAPETPGAIHDGMMGLAVFPAIASLYGAASILQQEHRALARWQPSISGALKVSWVGGWVLLLTVAVVTDLLSPGPGRARETLGFGLVLLALFVGLPWGIARMRRRATGSDRAFLDP